MSDDPKRVGDIEAVRAARDFLAGRGGPPPPPDDLSNGDDLEDIAELHARTIDEARAARWSRVCPQRFVRWTLDDEFHMARPKIRETLVEWARYPQGRNLVLVGPTGTGKTGAALAACRHPHDLGLEVRFLPVVELLDLLRPGGPEGVIDDLADVDRLILDDLGAEKATDWTDERLYRLLNRRWLEERPTVLTSNADGADPRKAFSEAVGDRLASRILGDGAVIVRLGGEDRRFSHGN